MSEAIIESHRRAVAVGLAALVGALSAAGLVAQDRGLQPVPVAQKRALLIGNARYVHTAPLVNTIPDVRALESALEEVGFDSVTRLEDQSLREMVRAVGEFAGSLRAGDLAFFYYSGHGLRVTNESHQSESYLLPVDYERTVASEVPFTALPATRVQARLESTGARVRVIVLDACRNNPFGEGRSAAEGLAAMEAKAEGTLIAYSAGAGQVASDNPGGGLGLYMTHLLPELREPTMDLWGAFKSTQARVWEASGKKQLPELYDSVVGGKVYLRGVPGGDVPGLRLAQGKCEGYWGDVRGSEDAGEYDWYLQQCGNAEHSVLARMRLARLRQPPVGPAGAQEEVGLPPPRPPPPPKDAPRAGEQREYDGMEFVWVPAGDFRMGSTSGEAADNESPVTEVRISEGYYLGKYEVTQGQWEEVMGSTPSEFQDCEAACPVENVSWRDAQTFIGNLNAGIGERWYRLPTEAEWEYAARAGAGLDRYGRVGGIAWYGGNSGGSPQPVGRKEPNAWGLHDMLGNVYEWVEDWYGEYPGGSVTDPAGPSSGSNRVLRGGGWNYGARDCRSSVRYFDSPGDRDLGFRLLRIQ